MTSRKWAVMALAGALALTVALGVATAVIDPLFHYHKPLAGFRYWMYDEWYQNDGIVRNFDYDAVITGTSMAENFKTTEFDALFGVSSVKVAFSGGNFADIARCLERAFVSQPEIRCVVRSLDMYKIERDKDESAYDGYPDYLYDDKLSNDVKYLLNKDVLLDFILPDLKLTLQGGDSTDFDGYMYWSDDVTYGKEAVIASETREEKREPQPDLTEQQRAMIRGNLEQNVIDLAREHPETEFYLFFPPYSVFWWDSLHREGRLEQQLEIERMTIELLLPWENIHLFSFCDRFDLVTDFDQYKDPRHYSGQVSSSILQWMQQGQGQLTAENYRAYCDRVRAFYTTYDYDALYS